MMPWGIASLRIREKGAMTAIMLLNMHTVLRGWNSIWKIRVIR